MRMCDFRNFRLLTVSWDFGSVCSLFTIGRGMWLKIVYASRWFQLVTTDRIPISVPVLLVEFISCGCRTEVPVCELHVSGWGGGGGFLLAPEGCAQVLATGSDASSKRWGEFFLHEFLSCFPTPTSMSMTSRFRLKGLVIRSDPPKIISLLTYVLPQHNPEIDSQVPPTLRRR